MNGRDIELGAVAAFIRGVTFKPDDVTAADNIDTVACMRTSNVQSVLDTSDVWRIPSELVKRPDQYLRDGDILVSSANSWNLVGKCCWVPELPGRATFGGFVSVLRVHAPALDPRYAYWWFESSRTQQVVRSFGRRTTSISNLDLARCLRLRIPLPALEEQRRIARVLDAADALNARCRDSSALTQPLLHAAFAAMFGHPSGQSRWPRAPVGDVAHVITGNTPPRAVAGNFGDFIGWIKNGNVRRDQPFVTTPDEGLSTVGAAKARIVDAGTVLVTCISGSPAQIGRVAITDTRVAFNQQINAIVSDAVDPRFLCTQLRMAPTRLRRLSSGGMKGMISKSALEGFELMLPPLDEQRRFGEVFDRIEAARVQSTRRNAESSALVASLQRRAFSGAL